ncbi:TRAP transporter small permease [Polymorphum gilvum]|uniref:TRAP transporter small permease protein n=1 Tax=Polymorphum gilvum (strain LMG 25793 / CGMCC 1.9160 / SL003B-26A1) TaxID=991905 RepID=F2IWZ2_POLGS|nr:TRAP transporter small permease [Polymorphum gilvum]ADZ71569.1 Possible TrapT family, dctQ subunit, C4-dicarboxylate transport [Polymorphum gilvum SL003B-26A1]
MIAIGKLLSRIEDTLHYGGCLALAAVVVLINADILMRLGFGRPVQIQFEMTELYLMPALATLSLSRVFRDGGHLALDIVPEHMPGLAGHVIRRIRLLLAAAFFAAVTYMSGKFALRAFTRGEIEFGVIDWPLGWAYAAIPLGCGVLVLRLFYETLNEGASNASP